MRTLQPEGLTNEELARHAYFYLAQGLDTRWQKELLKRFEAAIEELSSHNRRS